MRFLRQFIKQGRAPILDKVCLDACTLQVVGQFARIGAHYKRFVEQRHQLGMQGSGVTCLLGARLHNPGCPSSSFPVGNTADKSNEFPRFLMTRPDKQLADNLHSI